MLFTVPPNIHHRVTTGQPKHLGPVTQTSINRSWLKLVTFWFFAPGFPARLRAVFSIVIPWNHRDHELSFTLFSFPSGSSDPKRSGGSLGAQTLQKTTRVSQSSWDRLASSSCDVGKIPWDGSDTAFQTQLFFCHLFLSVLRQKQAIGPADEEYCELRQEILWKLVGGPTSEEEAVRTIVSTPCATRH